MIDTANFDLTQPIAGLLRQGTVAAHERAETSEGAGWLLRGELDRDEYARFLMMLWHVYDTLETALALHETLPALAPTYNPTLLARAPRLSADIAHLLDIAEAEWPNHPIHIALLASPPQPLIAYAGRLATLGGLPTPFSDVSAIKLGNGSATNSTPPADRLPNPAALLAHAYVRYLGDLSGGQVIRRRIAKAYGLDPEAEGAPGVAFYEFGSLGGARVRGTQGDMRQVKDWFRNGMNEGVGDDRELKAVLIREANIAFELNSALFSALRAPSKPVPRLTDLPPATPVLGDPTSPTLATAQYATMASASLVAAPGNASQASTPDTSVSSRSLSVSPERTDSKEQPAAIARASSTWWDRTYQVSSVAAFIAAVGLAHFVLVVGGVIGSKGWVSRLLEA